MIVNKRTKTKYTPKDFPDGVDITLTQEEFIELSAYLEGLGTTYPHPLGALSIVLLGIKEHR